MSKSLEYRFLVTFNPPMPENVTQLQTLCRQGWQIVGVTDYLSSARLIYHFQRERDATRD